MNIHEYQAKALLHRIRRADLARRPGAAGGRCRSCRQGASRPGLGGEEPDPCRRPRQGQVQGSLRRRQGRRADRQIGRRGHRIRQADARRHAGHDPDRPAGQAGQPHLRRGRLADRQGVLSVDPGRPRNLPGGVRGVDRRRRQHRGRRAQQSRKDRDLLGRPGHRHHAASRPHGCQGAESLRQSGQAGREAGDAALYRLHRQGHGDARNQPAGGYRAAAICACSTPR